MYQALTALKRSKARPFSGAEVAEIAVCLAAGEGVPVIRACAAAGARLVRKGGKDIRVTRRRIGAATIASAAALMDDAKACAVIVCVGKIGAQPEAQENFRTAFQFAARHKLPILYLVANSIAPGRPQTLDLRTLYAEFGIPVFSVDANDAIAAYRVATEALHNARHQRGPSVVEALTVQHTDGSMLNPRELLAAYMERHGNQPR
jgi:TPP-dependent pyruvate/acetoin dehydrogenase alpha subunit